MEHLLDDEDEEFIPNSDEDDLPEEDDEIELDELSKEFVTKLIDRCIEFMDALVGHSPTPLPDAFSAPYHRVCNNQ